MILMTSNKEKREKLQEQTLMVAQDLQKVLAVIQHKQHWCQRSLCRDEAGERLFDPFDVKAYSYCLLGVLFAIEAKNETFVYLKHLSKAIGFLDLDRLNDFNSHEVVLGFVVKAIENLGFKVTKVAIK